MRPGARRQYANRLRELSRAASEMADKMEVAELPDLRRVGIGWGTNGCEIDVGGTYVFQMPRDERHVVEIIRVLAWSLFEARRSGNPVDPTRLAEVRTILHDVGEAILGPRHDCPKCNGLQHVCVTCDSECQVPFSDPDHDRTTKLCPECSAWLAPEAPR